MCEMSCHGLKINLMLLSRVLEFTVGSNIKDYGGVQLLRKVVKSCSLPHFCIRVWILVAVVYVVLLYNARSRSWGLATQLALVSILIQSKSS